MTNPIDPSGKVFAHLDKLALLRAGEVPWPINAEIDLSNRCSLGCEWCHFAYTHTRGPLSGKRAKPDGAILGGDLMDVALARRLVRELAELGVSVTWTGGGEPTLHPAFDEIVQYGMRQGLKQAIYTHGGHIDDKRAARLKKALSFVYVSLDAADPVAYKRDKGVDRFEVVLENVRRLVAADGEATIGLGYLVTERNWADAGKAAALAREVGVDYIQFRPTILYDQEHPDQLAEDTDWMFKALTFLKSVGSMYGGPKDFVKVDYDRFRMYQTWVGHGYPTCWWSALQTCITPNGKVWTCVNKREHPGAEVGDLTAQSFAEVWASRPVASVSHDCRVMCRGQLPNLTLTEVMAPKTHPEFV